MTPRFAILPAADRDLGDQADYLAREASLDIALRFYDAARTTFEHLARMPNLGERRDTARPRLTGMRVWPIEGFANHLVFYRPVQGGIEIIARTRASLGPQDVTTWRTTARPTADAKMRAMPRRSVSQPRERASTYRYSGHTFVPPAPPCTSGGGPAYRYSGHTPAPPREAPPGCSRLADSSLLA